MARPDPWRTVHGPPTELGDYTYLELREADTESLRQFRNAQMDVLRQKAELTPDDQKGWFAEVVTPMHRGADPSFLLVSILRDGEFIGYGGLTNIDWDHRRAEISFLVDPDRAADAQAYEADYTAFIEFLRDWSFQDLGLNRLFTETYDFRTDHIALLERTGMKPEGILRQHTIGPDGEPTDSVMHGMLAGDPRPGKRAS